MSVLKPATEFNSFIVEERPGEQVITIRGVYLSFNQLSGVIPEEIGKNCGKLEHLDLFGNSLVQGIPSSLGNCGLLRTLLLHSNLLEEVIPIEFGNIKSLEVLAVLRNMLSSILGELGNCKELSIVVLPNLFDPIGDVEFDSLNDEFSELDEMNGEKMENSVSETANVSGGGFTPLWQDYVLSNYLYYTSFVMHFIGFAHRFLHSDVEIIVQMVLKVLDTLTSPKELIDLL